jgi:hypothetical protein
LARDLRVSERLVEDALEPLLAAHLAIRTPDGNEIRDGADGQTRELVRRALMAYREHRSEVLCLFNARAVTRVRLKLDGLKEMLMKRKADVPGPVGRK